MKKFISLSLAIIMALTLTVPAFAATDLSTTEPATPSGFTYCYKLEKDMDVDAALVNGVLKLTSRIPYFGEACAGIQAINWNDNFVAYDPNIDGAYTDYVYEADNPEVEYGVPYVYWHKLKMTYTNSNGSTEIRWQSYYEYAVAPR